VIRAALGEVEDYQRVTVRAVEPTMIMGSAAADFAHVLAELIENALIFSPPDQTVEVRGRIVPASPASQGGYTLAIVDSGLGMPTEELARANRRLAGTESFTIAPSRYLGHYVAGNLAARHDVTIHLQNNVGAGVAATINLPPTLLTAEPELRGDRSDPAFGAPELPAPPLPPPPPPPPPPPLPVATVLAASSPASTGWQPASASPAPPPPPGGLTRRVPGAQVPEREVIKLRRNAEPPRAPSAPDIYAFLANLEVGVQQGHDEAR
jgi:hypothetical protein